MSEYVTETRQDGTTYQRELSGIERMERGDTIGGLRQVIERDATMDLDCNWSDDSMQAIAVESLKAIEALRAALAEALDEWQRADRERQDAPPVMERVQLGIDNWTVRARPVPESQAARIAELRAKFLGR
jgi:hypothetical protein